MELIQEKLHPFKKLLGTTTLAGNNLLALPSDMYRLNKLVKVDNEKEFEISEISTAERVYSENNPLTKATSNRMVFERITGGSNSCRLYPTPTLNIITNCHYYVAPTTPRWNYTVVNSNALYNSTNSVHFELHPSEEEVLVSKILALAGVAILKPEVVQYGGGMEGAIKQSQND